MCRGRVAVLMAVARAGDSVGIDGDVGVDISGGGGGSGVSVDDCDDESMVVVCVLCAAEVCMLGLGDAGPETRMGRGGLEIGRDGIGRGQLRRWR